MTAAVASRRPTTGPTALTPSAREREAVGACDCTGLDHPQRGDYLVGLTPWPHGSSVCLARGRGCESRCPR